MDRPSAIATSPCLEFPAYLRMSAHTDQRETGARFSSPTPLPNYLAYCANTPSIMKSRSRVLLSSITSTVLVPPPKTPCRCRSGIHVVRPAVNPPKRLKVTLAGTIFRIGTRQRHCWAASLVEGNPRARRHGGSGGELSMVPAATTAAFARSDPDDRSRFATRSAVGDWSAGSLQ